MRRLFSAVLWGLFCGGLSWAIAKYALGFDILSGQDWDILFDKDLKIWPAQMASKKILAKVLLAEIIVGILGFGICLKKGREPKGHPVFDSVAVSPAPSSFVPTKMPSQGKAVSFQAPASAMVQNAPSQGQPTNSLGTAIHQLTLVAEQFDISVFPHVKLENTFTPLVVSDDSVALLLKILIHEGNWQLQASASPKESLWTIGEQPPQTLLKDILESTETLARLEPDAQAIATVVLTNGSFQDAPQVISYLTTQNIRVATLLPNNEKIEGIPTWDELLGEFYPPKQKDNNEQENITNI